MLRTTLAAVVLLAGASAPVSVHALSAPDKCDQTQACPGDAPNEIEVVTCPPPSGGVNYHGCIGDMQALRAAATPTTPAYDTTYLMCEAGFSNFDCEAFPQDDGPTGTFLRYSWTVTGHATLSGTTSQYSPFRSVGCNGTGSGTIKVTITTQFGVTASKTVNLYCY
jgi:hypothetical protein